MTVKQRTLQEKREKWGGDRKAPRPVLVSACQLDTLTKKDGISIELLLPSVGSAGQVCGSFSWLMVHAEGPAHCCVSSEQLVGGLHIKAS